MVTRRLQAELGTGSVRRPKTGVPPTVLRNQCDVTGTGDTVRSRLEWHAERSALFFHTGKDRADSVRAQLYRADLSTVANIRQTTTADLG